MFGLSTLTVEQCWMIHIQGRMNKKELKAHLEHRHLQGLPKKAYTLSLNRTLHEKLKDTCQIKETTSQVWTVKFKLQIQRDCFATTIRNETIRQCTTLTTLHDFDAEEQPDPHDPHTTWNLNSHHATTRKIKILAHLTKVLKIDPTTIRNISKSKRLLKEHEGSTKPNAAWSVTFTTEQHCRYWSKYGTALTPPPTTFDDANGKEMRFKTQTGWKSYDERVHEVLSGCRPYR